METEKVSGVKSHLSIPVRLHLTEQIDEHEVSKCKTLSVPSVVDYQQWSDRAGTFSLPRVQNGDCAKKLSPAPKVQHELRSNTYRQDL